VRLLIAGELPWKEHFEQLFSVMGLGERVTFLGHVDDIESFYSSCDVVALTCERRAPELFSNVMLEAMGTGCAVVATAGGTSELVVSGVNGYIESSRDPERFADRVITLLEREELRRALGRAARQSIVTRHAEPRVTEALADLLLRTRRSRD
jgi:glycosyltransferase involved in cell wall biosynthesis